MATPLAAIASRTASAPQPSPPASASRRSGWCVRERRERGDERRDVLPRFDACRRTRRTAARSRAPRAARDRASRRHPGRNRSWSTPCRATCTRPRGGVERCEPARRCTRETHTIAGGAARARADHAPEVRDLGALVPLGMVEERQVVHRHDGRDSVAQRHRVVRAVPHVGADPIARASRPQVCSHTSRARPRGREPRRAASPSGASAAQRSVSSRRVSEMQFDAGARGQPAGERPRVDAGAGRAGRHRRDVEQHAHRAQSKSQPVADAGPTASRNASTCAAADASQVSDSRAARSAPLQLARAARRRRGRVRGRRCSASTSPGGNSRPASPTTSVSAESSAATTRRAARERFERGKPEPLVARRDAATRRAPVRARRRRATAAVRARARRAGRGRRPRPIPAVRRRRARGRVACVRSRCSASTIVGRSLRGSTVPTVSRYGARTPARATVASISSGSRGTGRLTPSGASTTPSGSKPSRISSTRVNADGASTSDASRRAMLEAALVERHAAARRVPRARGGTRCRAP